MISELIRPSPSQTVIGWVRDHSPLELYATSITLVEILYGIKRLPPGRRKETLSSAATEVFAAFDAQIAATCRARGAMLATRNGKDFRDTGIDLVDPWTPA